MIMNATLKQANDGVLMRETPAPRSPLRFLVVHAALGRAGASPCSADTARGEVWDLAVDGRAASAVAKRPTDGGPPRAPPLPRTETCRYSGLKIYPGHGMKYIRGDSQTFLFLNAKCKSLFNQRKKPSKLAWTFQYRKAHKKDSNDTAKSKKRKTASKAVARSIVGASLEVIQKKRAEKPEQRQAARDAALREVKDRLKKMRDDKKRTQNQSKGATQKVAQKGRGKR